MLENFMFLWLIQGFILILGVALGHSAILLKLRSEENRQKELEISLLEKRSEFLLQEDVRYKEKVQKEIDDILKKD